MKLKFIELEISVYREHSNINAIPISIPTYSPGSLSRTEFCVLRKNLSRNLG